jgi:transposase
VSAIAPLDRIGVGIDTARYGHRVSFLSPDRQPAASPITVTEDRAGYQALEDRLKLLHQQHPAAHFHVRIDAAGQYAANLEMFLRSLKLPMTISVGEPKRNRDYHKVHFPKRSTDDTESQAMARFAVVELPAATPAPSAEMAVLREVAGRLQAQVKQKTRAVNRLHNLLARAFPELSTVADDIAVGWVLQLLETYPTAERLADAEPAALETIPFVTPGRAHKLHQAAGRSVATLRGPVAEALVRLLVTEVRLCQKAEKDLRRLLATAFAKLPASPHVHVVTIPGIGEATAAILVAKIVDIERFATPNKLVNYFGIFPEEERSGVDRQGRPLPAAPRHMSRKGNDLVRGYLWNASRVAIRHNPAIRALYRRLKARGKRGDVAVGHCMRKLLHLVFAVWKTDRPFDAKHFPWEDADTSPSTAATPDDAATTSSSAMKMAVNPAGDGTPRAAVAASGPAAEPAAHRIGPKPRRAAKDRPLVDFKFLRERVTMEQALRHLGLLAGLRGSGPQRRGPCPLHSHPGATERTFSVHLGKGAFRCFHAECGAEGNVLDLWAAIHRLPLYEAALHLAETLGLPRNREEEPVVGTRSPQVTTARPARTASRAGGPP